MVRAVIKVTKTLPLAADPAQMSIPKQNRMEINNVLTPVHGNLGRVKYICIHIEDAWMGSTHS